MKIVIAGGGMVGLALGRMLRKRGFEPVILERAPAGNHAPRGYMLGFQGFPALEDMGVLDEVRETGWDIAPRPDGQPVAICVDFVYCVNKIGEGVPVANEETVVELVKDDDGRVVGVVTEGPGGRGTIEADLVVACDGTGSGIRRMAGLPETRHEMGKGSLAFMSPAVVDRSFAMKYLSDGMIIGLLGWPGGSAGWWIIDKIGPEAALAPGLDALKKSWATLMPEAAPALEQVISLDQVRYSEPFVISCEKWWTPGVVLIGDAAHFFGPETGVSSGLGLGDAHALAEAIAQNPDDPDAACQSFVTWREPVVRPYEATDPARQPQPQVPNDRKPPEERWPPE